MLIRLWLVIVLSAWTGQGGLDRPGPLAAASVSWGDAWVLGENWVEWMAYYARQLKPWPSSSSRYSRGRRRRGKKPSLPAKGTKTGGGPSSQKTKGPPQEAEESSGESVFAPQRWGLAPSMDRELPAQLREFWQRYADRFKTKTRDTSEYAYHYLSGLLRLETERHYTNIGQVAGVSGENIQHFMSNSPWVAQAVLEQVREEIKATPGLEQGSVLLLDESADKKAGDESVGAGRQWNGRLGKVDMSQVGTFLAYANVTDPNRPLWTWIDGRLYLQEHWFTPEMEEKRQKVGLPEERTFETKIEEGWEMIQQAIAAGLPFEAIACDDLYGRSTWLRDKMAGTERIYMADVPRNTQVYLRKPVLGVPEPPPGHRGRKPSRLQVLNEAKAFPVHQVRHQADTKWQRIPVRSTERGVLNDPFAARRVWTLREGQAEPVEEWLVIRRETKKRYSYALSNAPANTSLKKLAWLKCQRYFVERANQEAKSEAGWDELRARKYRGWEHHLALVILAIWFMAQTKWDWAQQYSRDPDLARQFGVEVLPVLSMANIRLLLRAAMPLPQLTPEEARARIAHHFVNRTRSRKSRLRRQEMSVNANAPP